MRLALAILPVSLLIACGDDGGSGSTTGLDGGAGGANTGAAGGGGGAPVGGGGSGGDGAGGAGGQIPSGIPMFVAQGHLGRTTISCDAGESWVAERSNDDSAVCWAAPDNQPDCDHDPGAGRGIAYGDGWFVATFGWGPPGGLFRSRDGVAWEETLSGTTFAGVSYGNGVFLAGGGVPQRSDDSGATWTALDSVDLGGNARRMGFADVDGGRFVIAADGSKLAVSDDNGDTWSLPNAPAGCGDSIQTDGGIAGGNGVILVLGGQGNACVSDDAGATWTLHQVGASISSHLVFTGSEFMAWGEGQAHSSSDGVNWTSTPTNPANINIGPSAVSPEGAFVAVRGGWQVWYEDQAFYRSDDGVNWTTLASGSFTGSHPIRAMAFGYGDASAACP